MSGVNKVIQIGNLGQDPEVKYMPSGKAVCNISIANSEKYTDKDTGEQVEKTEWHRLVFFGKLAEVAGEWLRKGSQIYIEGKLQTRQWEKEGVKHYSTEIIVNRMQMLGGRDVVGDSDSKRSAPAPSTPSNDDFNDDIPF